MERNLQVTINSGYSSCDDCEFLCQSEKGNHYWCDLFGVDPIDYGDGPERSQECLDAEKKYRYIASSTVNYYL